MLARFIERLRPPVEGLAPISFDARKQLTQWGLGTQEVQDLQQIVAEYDQAYSHCSEKVAIMHTLKVKDRSRVILPSLSEATSVKNSGDCRDIADSLARALQELSFVGKDSSRVDVVLARGSNKTHFKMGSHVWVGLVERNQSGIKKESMVALDGAYQDIGHMKSNGYRVYGADYPQDVEPNDKTALPLSDIDVFSNSIKVYQPSDRVLGLSYDKSVSFSIGFTSVEGKIVPFFRLGHSNGQDSAIYLLNPNSQKINRDFNNDEFELTLGTKAELSTMLEMASRITFA